MTSTKIAAATISRITNRSDMVRASGAVGLKMELATTTSM